MTVQRHLLTLGAGLVAGALVLSGGTVGAASSTSPAVPPSPPPGTQTGMVRFVNASPNAPVLVPYLDGKAFDPGLAYAFGVVGDYQPVAAGTEALTVFPTGADAATAKPVLTKDLTVEAGKRYTVAVANDLGQIEAEVYTDAPTPTADQAQVRVVHLSADTTGVDVLPSGKDVPLFSGVKFPDATPYQDIQPGVASLDVRNAGEATVAMTSSPIDFEAGDSTSVFIIGAAKPADGAQPLRMVTAVDDSVDTHVRFLMASPDAGPVDLWIDGAKVDALSGITFGTVSAYDRLPAGEHRVQVMAAGTEAGSGTPILDVSETFGPARYHTFAISGPATAAEPSLFWDQAHAPVADGRLRIVQLSADTAAIDAGRKGEPPAVTGLAYGRASDYLTEDPGAYDLSIRGTGTSEDLLEIEPLQLEEGTDSSAYLIGSSTGAAGAQPLTVVVVQDAATR